ncbi:MAG: hypothetical protein ACYT04_89190, partial [Nostoc sp.]
MKFKRIGASPSHRVGSQRDAENLLLKLDPFILTQADRRLSAVESWVCQHHQTWSMITRWKIRDSPF